MRYSLQTLLVEAGLTEREAEYVLLRNTGLGYHLAGVATGKYMSLARRHTVKGLDKLRVYADKYGIDVDKEFPNLWHRKSRYRINTNMPQPLQDLEIAAKKARLGKRQTEAILLTANGKGHLEVAARLGLKPSQAKQAIETGLERLGANPERYFPKLIDSGYGMFDLCVDAGLAQEQTQIIVMLSEGWSKAALQRRLHIPSTTFDERYAETLEALQRYVASAKLEPSTLSEWQEREELEQERQQSETENLMAQDQPEHADLQYRNTHRGWQPDGWRVVSSKQDEMKVV